MCQTWRIFVLTKAKNMTTLSNETATAAAIKMTILDAIEKGHTNPAELAEYMKSEVFEKSVKIYKEMFKTEF